MAAVTVSPKYQVVIPKEIRKRLDLLPGQKLQVIMHGNRIELLPVLPAKRVRGFLHAIDTRLPHQADPV